MGCNNLRGIIGVRPVIKRESKMVLNVQSTLMQGGGHGLLKPSQRLILPRHFWMKRLWWKIVLKLGWQRGRTVNRSHL